MSKLYEVILSYLDAETVHKYAASKDEACTFINRQVVDAIRKVQPTNTVSVEPIENVSGHDMIPEGSMIVFKCSPKSRSAEQILRTVLIVHEIPEDVLKKVFTTCCSSCPYMLTTTTSPSWLRTAECQTGHAVLDTSMTDMTTVDKIASNGVGYTMSSNYNYHDSDSCGELMYATNRMADTSLTGFASADAATETKPFEESVFRVVAYNGNYIKIPLDKKDEFNSSLDKDAQLYGEQIRRRIISAGIHPSNETIKLWATEDGAAPGQAVYAFDATKLRAVPLFEDVDPKYTPHLIL